MFEIFRDYPGILVAVSEKKDGSCRVFPSGSMEEDTLTQKNRERFLGRLGIREESLVSASLTHGNNVVVVDRNDAGSRVSNVDGLLTGDKELFLSVTVADCLPIFFYDPEHGAAGLIHAGWRGLVGDIPGKAIGKLIKEFGSNPASLLIGVGPGIGPCHYDIPEERAAQFLSAPKEVTGKIFVRRDNKLFLDLRETAKFELLSRGVRERNIEINPECTYCLSEKYFSYRRDKPKILQAMMAVIGLRSA